MREICVVVEGQTEEQFIKMVLAPLALAQGTYVQPIIVRTNRSKAKVHKGGGSSWKHYRNLVQSLTAQHWERIGVMFDLYACPSDTPGYSASLTGTQLHSAVALGTQQDLEYIAPRRALAGPILHELETLVLAAIATEATEADDEIVAHAKAAIRDAGDNVEMVNGNPNTAPSKRLEAWWPGYEKVLYGAVLLAEPPWQEIADRCPTFSTWWNRLLG